MLAGGAVLYLDLNIVSNMTGSMSQVMYILLIALGFLYLIIFLYIYPVLGQIL